MTLIATSPRNILQLIPKNANIAPWSHSQKKKNVYRFSTLRSVQSFHLLTLPTFNNKAKSCSSTFNKHDGTKTCWTKLLEVWGMPSAVCHAATPKIVQSQSLTFRLSSKPRNTSLHTNLERITVSFGLANHVAMWMLPRAFCPPLSRWGSNPTWIPETNMQGRFICVSFHAAVNIITGSRINIMQSGAYTIYTGICKYMYMCKLIYSSLFLLNTDTNIYLSI